MSDTKIKGTYVKTELGWDVRFKIETEDGKDTEQVMLHPNGNINAKEGQQAWFTIKDCPNLHNGGEWERMAIVVPSDKLLEVAENIKGKPLFKRLNDHAMSALLNVDSIPDPDNIPLIKTFNFSDEAILSNALKFTFGIVSDKGSLDAEQFTKAKSGFMHVARWIRDNWKEADEDFLSAQEGKL
jgi:hypothetical protein